MRWNRVLTVVLFFAVAIIGLTLLRRWLPPAQPPQPESMTASTENASAGTYADPASCAVCHDQIARTYSQTGMGRSFSRLPAAAGPVADFSKRNRLQHTASGREYTMFERDGKFFQRRHDVGFDGKESNVVEMEANYVVGSGNHARTFVHRRADGRLLQMPVTWYAERGGFWAMSPGYDRPAHADFRRLIVEDCMSCHNGYPRAGVQDDGNGPKFIEPLPQGIDCQRCHGPGQAHVDAIKRGDVEAGVRGIVNPSKLDRERQLETCMQCHLEYAATSTHRFPSCRADRSVSTSFTSITRRARAGTTSSRSRAPRID
jgi:hypothetical protein